jgi:hypothetical protein
MVNFPNPARSVARLAANFSGVWVKMACSLWKFFLYKEAQARISGLHENSFRRKLRKEQR